MPVHFVLDHGIGVKSPQVVDECQKIAQAVTATSEARRAKQVAKRVALERGDCATSEASRYKVQVVR